jgi:hypothetical protein
MDRIVVPLTDWKVMRVFGWKDPTASTLSTRNRSRVARRCHACEINMSVGDSKRMLRVLCRPGCSRPSMNSLSLYAANEGDGWIEPRLFPCEGKLILVPPTLSVIWWYGRKLGFKKRHGYCLTDRVAHLISECRAHRSAIQFTA